ncbi:alpha/beta fold hydrolase [Planctomycetota bacterium]
MCRGRWIATREAREAFSAVVERPSERWVLPRSALQAIDVPTLVLWAERDRLFGTGTARKLAGDIPGAHLTLVPDCGHFLQEEEPLVVARTIGQFVERKHARRRPSERPIGSRATA